MTKSQSGATVPAAAGQGAHRPARRTYMIAAAALVAAAVVVAILLGGSGSKTTTHSATSATAAHTDVRTAAVYLGVPAKKLRRELRAGRTIAQVAAATPGKSQAGLIEAITSTRAAALAAAVASGKLSSAQERAQLAALRAQAAGEVNRARATRKATGAAAIAASYLGRTLEQLRREQAEGHSLAQIANSTPGRSASGLTARIIAVERARISAQTGAGAIGPAAERQLLADLERRVALRVNAVPRKRATG